jgi:hypothetical protein
VERAWDHDAMEAGELIAGEIVVSHATLHVGSAHETESIPLTEYFPIFRVPEYSELSVAI